VHHFWDNSAKYDAMGRKAMQRLLGIVHMNPEIDPRTWDHTDEDIYGIGGVRSVDKFYETFGIDVVRKTIEAHMCSFVDGKAETSMHRMFHPHLRKDGMGLNYGEIHYKFVDPEKKEKAARQALRGNKAKAANEQKRQEAEGGEDAEDPGDDQANEEPTD